MNVRHLRPRHHAAAQGRALAIGLALTAALLGITVGQAAHDRAGAASHAVVQSHAAVQPHVAAQAQPGEIDWP